MERRRQVSDEELLYHQREVSGGAVGTCERCGRPLMSAQQAVSERLSMDQRDPPARLCPSCQALIATNDDPLDLDDDEP
jgi:hypothetical protein